MKIDNIKDFKQFVQLCQKLGVTNVSVDGITMTLGPLPTTPPRKTGKAVPTKTIMGPAGAIEVPLSDLPDVIDMPDQLTEEQLLMYSAVQNEGGPN